jgi:transcriptional regulator with XRE-family HTH domain
MTALLELGRAVQARRTQMGLTQGALAALTGLSRQTISQLESGTIKDLSLQRAERLAGVLGLSLQVARPFASRRPVASRLTPLGRAARTASVSYRKPIAPARLRKVLVRGEAAPADTPYVHALLDEAPTSLLASVAEQLQGDAGGSTAVWNNYRKLAQQVKSRRNLWQ